MRKALILLILVNLLSAELVAQKNIRTFIFGHSLINHEFQINPTPSQETSVPHWLHFLAQEAEHDFALSGQYGFLPQHANLPPIAQWGFDFAIGAWDSDNEPFSAADFNTILITPGNFIQWQGPDENYPTDNISPLGATENIFNWCNSQEDSLVFYIYENWPDMGSYLGNGFPPTSVEWSTYNDYLNNDFHDWFLEYHNALIQSFPNSCIRMIPVGPIISNLLLQAPFDQIPIEELYEDDAPHGRSTTYFLASLITYMAMYEEQPPSSYQVDPIIHPIIADNYQTIIDFIWEELNSFDDVSGESRVFCAPPINVSIKNTNPIVEITLIPNPTSEYLKIEGIAETHFIDIYSIDGIKWKSVEASNVIDLKSLPEGIYVVIGRKEEEVLYRKKIVKMDRL